MGACACVYEYSREGGKEGGQTADVRRKVKVGSMCVCVCNVNARFPLQSVSDRKGVEGGNEKRKRDGGWLIK